MNKFIAIVAIACAIACVNAKPAVLPFAPVAPVAYTAPVVAPAPLPFVTATSSQVVSRNYNYLASPLVADSPYIASPAIPLAHPSPYIAAPFTSPVLL